MIPVAPTREDEVVDIRGEFSSEVFVDSSLPALRLGKHGLGKHELAAYKSFEDYRLFSDGYVESLVTAQLNQEGVHVYVAKVRPLMKIKTDEGKLRKGVLRSLVYSLRVEVQTEVVYFRQDASVKVVEMGDV